MNELKKIVKDLNEQGWSVVRHSCDDECPDNWFVFTVWKSFDEKKLWFYYDWRKGKYYFFVWPARKQVELDKNKSYDLYKVSDIIQQNFGQMIPCAKRIAKALDAKGIYLTKNLDKIRFIEQDYDLFVGLVNWFSAEDYEGCSGLKSDGPKPYFIIGDPKIAIRKLRRLGYKTIQTYDEDGNEDLQYVIDAHFGYLDFDWDEIKEEIEEFIDDDIQRELGDCIWSGSYDEEQDAWIYELDLDESYEENVRNYVMSWNRCKHYRIKCRMTDTETGLGYGLLFKNSFKK